MSIVGYGLGVDIDVADFSVGFGFGIYELVPIFPINDSTIGTFIVLQELRSLQVGIEKRIFTITEQDRSIPVYFEDRTIIIPEKLD